MKHTFVCAILLPACGALLLASTLRAAESEPRVLERGLHHRVVENASGGIYTVLADGMHYESDGQMLGSREEIELFQDGAIARHGQHKVIFSPNLKTAGAIDLLTPDGKRFRSHVFGLVYYDSASGQSTLLAETKDSIGQLVAPARIVYVDAFDAIQADVQFTYRIGSFEQDVVLLQALPSPLDYGMNPETTRLQVWTEFVEAPVAQEKSTVLREETNLAVRQLMAEPDLKDTHLDFGAFYIGQGRAFSVTEKPEHPQPSVIVAKEWANVENRRFLIESVEMPTLKPMLDALPAAAAAAPANPGNVAAAKRKSVRSRTELLAQAGRLAAAPRSGKIQMAQLAPRNRAVVVDYITLSSGQNNYVFKGDSTYLIANQATFGGTTTLEGGAILKFNSGAEMRITGSGAKLNCLTSPYRPAMLVSKDDNSVGETIYMSTGVPYMYYATYALYFDYASSGVASTVHNLRIRHANTGIYYTSGSGHVVRHSQIHGYNKALDGGSGSITRLQNVLLTTSGNAVNGSLAVRGEHVTVDGGGLSSGFPVSVSLTNSLLEVTSGSAVGVSNYNVTAAAFQTVLSSTHFLADSTYRNAGTTVIDPDLATDLKSRTTYPPLHLTSDFTIPTVLSPQAQRDTDLPDCGYHHDPVDFTWTGLNLSSSLLLTNGVAVSIYGTNGLILKPGAGFISEGHPLRLNRIVRHERLNATPLSIFKLTNSGTPLPTVRMRFTDVSILADISTAQYVVENANSYPLGVLALTDCHLRGGYINLQNHGSNASGVTMAFTNNFLQRVNFTFRQGYGGDTTPAALHFYNNLVVGSSLTLQGGSQSSPFLAWTAKDNLFDTVTLSASTFGNSHNAYTAATTLPGSSGSDWTSIVPNYVTSTLGTNYYGTSPPLSNLMNSGSRNRDAATLYHHTVRADHQKEGEDTGSAVVDIGFHYIALSSGLPKDSDGDGLADFIENRNGTGVYNASTDPSDWNSYNSPNGLAGSPGLQVFTPLK